MKKIAVMTTTRAEYGLLKPVIAKIHAEEGWDLLLMVGGTHLLPEWGNTIREIEADGFPITQTFAAFPSEDSAWAVAKSMGAITAETADFFRCRKPDVFLVLGDRYEIFAAVTAAYTMGIPVAHIAGGEVTAGALDEAYRHGITKMSRLHFTAKELYRRRVIRLGEEPESVIMTGDLGGENIRRLSLLSWQELAGELAIPENLPFVLATYHPVTLAESDCRQEMQELFRACDAFPQMGFLFTMANADANGRQINQMLQEYAAAHPQRIFVFASLGQIRYLSAMKHCQLVLGNSSSGILEAPIMGVATVNIGMRQDGRYREPSVIDCPANAEAIICAMQKAMSDPFRERLADRIRQKAPKQEPSERIVYELKRFLENHDHRPAKGFYDGDIDADKGEEI